MKHEAGPYQGQGDAGIRQCIFQQTKGTGVSNRLAGQADQQDGVADHDQQRPKSIQKSLEIEFQYHDIVLPHKALPGFCGSKHQRAVSGGFI